VLLEARLVQEGIESLSAHFPQEFGRIRTVKLGPDGFLYLVTNNRDGRGTPFLGDDKVVKIAPDIFEVQ
jgi:glucose/arabinose dehydrogenase